MHMRALVFPTINSFGGVDILDEEKITNFFNEIDVTQFFT